MIYIELFLSFLQIGLFSIGGGYAALPLIEDSIVSEHTWITTTQFADILTISQMTPGPIAINAATFVGIEVAGLLGAVVAVLGFVVPSMVIVLLLVLLYYKFRSLEVVDGVFKTLQPAVVALIISAGISIIITAFYGSGGFITDIRAIDFIAVIIFALCLVVLRKFKISPVMVMLFSAVAGLAVYPFI